MKKFLSLLLSFIIILSVFSGVTVNAASVVASGKCGDNLTWTLDSDGLLTISGTGSMKNYSNGSSPWYSYRKSVKSVVIKDGVTSIGDYAFYSCNSLTSITIPNSVTSIGNYAFYSCRSLTSITIPDSVTSIGNYAFAWCESLTSVTIGDSVTSIGMGAFHSCKSLTSVTIGDSVTSIGGSAFEDCDSLTSVTIPDSVTSIGNYAFCDCKSLTDVTIPDSVTSIGEGAFHSCKSLTSVTIGDSVTSVGEGAFFDCTALTSITIPDSVTSIGNYAFSYCESITDVYYNGTKEQWAKISIGSYNESLTTANIHFIDDALVVDNETVFANSTFTVTFTQPKTVMASTLRLNLKFDNKAFEVVEIAKAPFATIKPNVSSCNNNGNVNLFWTDPSSDANTEIEKDTVLLEVTFKVKDTASLGDKFFEVTEYSITGAFSEDTFDFENVTPDAGILIKTIKVVEAPSYTLSGNVKAFGDSSNNVTIELLSDGEVVDTKTVIGNTGKYTFEKVSSGKYTVKVSKSKHCAREYGVLIADADVLLDTEIWLYGDVNTDGAVNNVDTLQMNRMGANLSSIFNSGDDNVKAYRKKVANITAITGTDNLINNADILQINRNITNVSSIFDRIA